jgi:hypothetical protein
VCLNACVSLVRAFLYRRVNMCAPWQAVGQKRVELGEKCLRSGGRPESCCQASVQGASLAAGPVASAVRLAADHQRPCLLGQGPRHAAQPHLPLHLQDAYTMLHVRTCDYHRAKTSACCCAAAFASAPIERAHTHTHTNTHSTAPLTKCD